MNGVRTRRPTLLLLATASCALLSTMSAQQATSDAGFVAPRRTKPRVDTAPIEKPAPYDINGVVAQAFKMKKPLEMINPLAPASYGGNQDISWDPDNPEIPKGIIILGIQW